MSYSILAEPSLPVAAEAYARSGWRVFAVAANSKVPDRRLAPSGVHSASSDPARIAAIWREGPDCNIGLALGGYGQNDYMFVLDVDPDRGGLEALAELATVCPLPPTLRTRTPSGGAHYFLSSAAPVFNSFDRLGPGIEVRTAGWYVLAPPSRLSTGGYVFETPNTPIAAAPDCLTAHISRPPDRRRRRSRKEVTPLSLDGEMRPFRRRP